MSTAYVAVFLLYVHALNQERQPRVSEALLRLRAEDLSWLLAARAKLHELREGYDSSLAELCFEGMPTGMILVDDDEDTQAASAAAKATVGGGRDHVRLTREQVKLVEEYGEIPSVTPEIPRVMVDVFGVSFHFGDPEANGRYETMCLPWGEIEKIR